MRAQSAAPRLERRFFRDIWWLTKPYWVSEQRWSALALLAAVVGLTVFQVLVRLRLTLCIGALLTAVQNYDAHEAYRQIGIYIVIAIIYVSARSAAPFLQGLLVIRWRRWLTDRYLAAWLGHKAYYRMELIDRGTDNPDQRIQEDLGLFPASTLDLFIGLLDSLITFVSYIGLVWSLSGALTVPLGSLGTVTIPGYAVYIAVLYALGGTWLTAKLGHPLVALRFFQQRYEADFRYSMVRLRENAESIAFFGGEAREGGALHGRFNIVYDNIRAIIRRTIILGAFTASFGQAAVMVPLGIAFGPYFAKKITLGGVQKLMDSFDQIQTALSWIVNSYTTIADFQSVVFRLSTFRRQVEEVVPSDEKAGALQIEKSGAPELAVDDLRLDLPNGHRLLDHVSLRLTPGEALLLTGPSGVGKSTLLRAIAHIWPFGTGTIRHGFTRPLFLPQRPYLPIGTLREVALYPHGDPATSDDTIRTALDRVGLGALAGELATPDNWATRLSQGEQQRLNFARILLQHPDAVFMDEASSALDEPAEQALYTLLRGLPDRPTVVSVGHRSTLKPLHDRIFDLAGATGAIAPEPAE